ncbi:peptidoglycan DD-metalloendopeptidase family protein [Pendulispora brunnea]|uniref:Peptidoglycan DD-metalloendopeptidase family protein n=1 Tax=Pendulispora brunnea TaxID=2905690 RepID=A0ABZ2K0D8_9BACT
MTSFGYVPPLAMALLFGVGACSSGRNEELATEQASTFGDTAFCPAEGPITQWYHDGHDGVDIGGALSAPIFATAAGEVTASGPAQGYGQWIRIRHDDGSMTEYGHMHTRFVEVGDRVNGGDRIALIGAEGQATGPHLHIRTYNRAGDAHGIDPVDYLGARGVPLPCQAGQGGGGSTTCPGGSGAVEGAINAKYRALGGCESVLGVPLTDELTTPDTRGRYNVFERGSIYWTESTDAHEVHGAIRDKWRDLKWETGELGYPITDEFTTPDGYGRYNVFERGSIYWTSGTGAHEVRGAIRDRWKDEGWEAGHLGYPTSDEYDVGNDRQSDFEHGSIQWIRAINQTKVILKSSP